MLEQIFLSAPGKIVSFYPFSLTKKPDFDFIDFFVFPFTLSVMYVTLILLKELICLVSYSVFNELQLNFH